MRAVTWRGSTRVRNVNPMRPAYSRGNFASTGHWFHHLYSVANNMNNGSFLRTLKASTLRTLSCKCTKHQIRCESTKFLIPPSFRPEFAAKQNRQHSQHEKDRQARLERTRHAVKGILEVNQPVEKLDHHVELKLLKASGNEFGMTTAPLLHQFCGQTHHPELSSFMRGYVSTDRMDLHALRLLWDALQRFLPPDPLVEHLGTLRGTIHHLSYSYGNPVQFATNPRPDTSYNLLNMGWHLVAFKPPHPGQGLLFDGTDDRFLPGPPAVWRHRLWAGGSINLHKMFAPNINDRPLQHQVESPIGFRIVGQNHHPDKVFVTIQKRFYSVEMKISKGEYNLPDLLRILKEEPKYNKKHIQVAGPWLDETYTLCFLRDAPNLSRKGTATRVIAPPTQPRFSHTFTPDSHLLFCWSALTHNAHRIHLDQMFAREQYRASNLIVHGPLILVFVLEWFHREITKYAMERQLPRFHLKSIDYKNLIPMFVDEPMTICTKPSKFQKPGSLADSWEVWVQKDLEAGLTSMTFKGTIKLVIEKEPTMTERGSYVQAMGDEDSEDSKAEEDQVFKSPFF